MSYRAINIASFFLNKAEPKQNMTNLQLQKLVYIAFGWHTVFVGENLYEDRIEAWRYGPVIPTLYYRFSTFENGPIKTRTINDNITVFRPVDGEIEFPLVIEKDTFMDGFLTLIFEEYMKKPAHELVDLTHGKATPWDKVYVSGAKVEIPKALIKEYYGRLAEQS